MTPSPPALETAAARGPEEVRAMPARMTGYSIPRREQRGVERMGRELSLSIMEAEMFMLDDWCRGMGCVVQVASLLSRWFVVGEEWSAETRSSRRRHHDNRETSRCSVDRLRL